MIRPIANETHTPLKRFIENNPLSFAFIVLFSAIALTYVLYRVERKYKNPEALYQKALKLPPNEAIPLLVDAARFHHPKAKLLLAALYLKIGNHDETLRLIHDLDTAEAIYLQGMIYQKKNEPLKALQKFVVASIRGYVPAYKHAGAGFIERDLTTALNYFERGIAANDPDSMLALSGILLTGACGIGRENSLRALSLIRRAANLNSIDACNTLSHLFFRGLYNELDEAEVRNRLEYAASRNNVQALLSIGIQKLNGSMLYLKKPQEGIEILTKIKKNLTAILQIAKYFESQSDQQTALKWFLKGAKQEHPECLYRAYAITKNGAYLKRAADKNHPNALYDLAEMALREGDREAYSYYLLKSAEAGNLKAAFIFSSLLASRQYDDESKVERIAVSLNILGPKFPESYFILHNFYLKHNQEEKAIEALVQGSSYDSLNCMKALYHIHKQMREEIESAELLLRRIRAREPSFMAIEEDVEAKGASLW